MTRNRSDAVASLLAACSGVVLGLAANAHSQTMTWSGPGGGNWNDASKWAPQNVPDAAGESALIAADGSSPTLTMNISPVIDWVRIENPLAELSINNNNLTLRDAVIGLDNSGTVLSQGGAPKITGVVTNRAGGAIAIAGGGGLSFSSGAIVNDGQIIVNLNAAANTKTLSFISDVDLTGSGSLVLNRQGYAVVQSGYQTINQGAGHTIRGAGHMSVNLNNAGVVAADLDGQILLVKSGVVNNAALFKAVNGGLLDIEDTITQAPTGVMLADGGTVRLKVYSRIVGGTLQSTAGSFILGDGNTTLQDVTIAVDSTYGVRNGTTTRLSGTRVVNHGNLVVNHGSVASFTYCNLDSDLTLEGTGQLSLNREFYALLQTGNYELNHAATHTIRGAGRIMGRISNAGVIAADTDGSVLLISDATIGNTGTLKAGNNGELQLAKTTVTQTAGGRILADGGTVRLMSGATVAGGSLGCAGGSQIIGDGAVTLEDVTIEPGAWYGIPYGKTTTAQGAALVNNGSIVVNPTGNAAITKLDITGSTGLSGDGTLSVISAYASVAADHIRQGGLILDRGTVTVRPNGTAAGTSRLNSLTFTGMADAWTGKFDLADNDLIVQAAVDTREQVLAQVSNQIKTARNRPVLWTGDGITSSAARLSPMNSLGVVLNSKGQSAGMLFDVFSGQVVDETCILVKYTWNGDANLDGVVNADDYFQIDSGFISQRQGWYNGDFNYDGVINADDYFLIDSAFIGQTGPLAAVPEPAMAVVWVGGLMGLLWGRRRHCRRA